MRCNLINYLFGMGWFTLLNIVVLLLLIPHQNKYTMAMASPISSRSISKNTLLDNSESDDMIHIWIVAHSHDDAGCKN